MERKARHLNRREKVSLDLLNTWRDSPAVPAGWRAADPSGAVVKVPVKNTAVKALLQATLPGRWVKVYHRGQDGTEVHDFQHASGRVAFVKHKVYIMPVASPHNLIESLAGGGRALHRHVVEMGLGIIASIRSGHMTFDEARADLFNIDNYGELKRRRAAPALIEFFEVAMELEDVAGLAPDALPESYDRLDALAADVLRRKSGPGATD